MTGTVQPVAIVLIPDALSVCVNDRGGTLTILIDHDRRLSTSALPEQMQIAICKYRSTLQENLISRLQCQVVNLLQAVEWCTFRCTVICILTMKSADIIGDSCTAGCSLCRLCPHCRSNCGAEHCQRGHSCKYFFLHHSPLLLILLPLHIRHVLLQHFRRSVPHSVNGIPDLKVSHNAHSSR